jgi:hypothetical protein
MDFSGFLFKCLLVWATIIIIIIVITNTFIYLLFIYFGGTGV